MKCHAYFPAVKFILNIMKSNIPHTNLKVAAYISLRLLIVANDVAFGQYYSVVK